MSGKQRILVYFQNRVGEVVYTDELIQVSGIKSAARRVRELRDEDGYDIVSHNDDDQLKPGQYIMRSREQREYVTPRSISTRLRAEILERNGYTCQMCGAGAGDPDELKPGRKVRMHVGHVDHKKFGGADDPSNLRTLCHNCNQGAKDITPVPQKQAWLLGQVRRASRSDQIAVKQWLDSKFASGEEGT